MPNRFVTDELPPAPPRHHGRPAAGGRRLAGPLCARALGETIPLVGPEPWTGSAITALWSRVLGRELRHVGADLDAWAAQARAHRPDWVVDSLTAVYRAVRERGGPASPAEIAAGAELVGHPLRRYEDFARQLAAGEPVL